MDDPSIVENRTTCYAILNIKQSMLLFRVIDSISASDIKEDLYGICRKPKTILPGLSPVRSN